MFHTLFYKVSKSRLVLELQLYCLRQGRACWWQGGKGAGSTFTVTLVEPCFAFFYDWGHIFSTFVKSQMQKHFPLGKISWRCRLSKCKFQISNMITYLPNLSVQIIPVKPVEVDHLILCITVCLLWWPQLLSVKLSQTGSDHSPTHLV